MTKLDTQVDTAVSTSAKISIGFMVATGLIVVTSFLLAAGYIGWQKLTGAAPITEVVSESTTTNETVMDDAAPSVKGQTEDYTFSTE